MLQLAVGADLDAVDVVDQRVGERGRGEKRRGEREERCLCMAARIALFARASEALGPRADAMQPPTIDDIRAAAERIEGAVIRTPMLVSRTLSEIIGAEVWLKFENLQFTAAYKERGALNKLLQLTDEERARGVIAASAGNHAQAVAYHAKRLGIPATIVMPTTTPTVKVTQTEGHGAKVVLDGDMFDDAYRQGARAGARERLSCSSTRSTIRRSSPAPGTVGARNARGRAGPRHARRADRRRRADVGHRRSPRARSSPTSS